MRSIVTLVPLLFLSSSVFAQTNERCFVFDPTTSTFYGWHVAYPYNCKCEGDLTIPATIGGVSVSQIGTRIFDWCSQPIVLHLPLSIHDIPNDAFRFTHLTDITGLDGVSNIGESAFEQTDLSRIRLPSSVTTIGNYAFAWSQLTQVTISNHLKRIEDYSFYSNKLVTAEIPPGVVEIGRFAFSYNKLATINIPDSVQLIELHAFSSNLLTAVSVPMHTVIEPYAFDDSVQIIRRP